MAILRGFPPSNTIHPTTRISTTPSRHNIWLQRYYKKQLVRRINQLGQLGQLGGFTTPPNAKP